MSCSVGNVLASEHACRLLSLGCRAPWLQPAWLQHSSSLREVWTFWKEEAAKREFGPTPAEAAKLR